MDSFIVYCNNRDRLKGTTLSRGGVRIALNKFVNSKYVKCEVVLFIQVLFVFGGR